jgi:hypothetical protein
LYPPFFVGDGASPTFPLALVSFPILCTRSFFIRGRGCLRLFRHFSLHAHSLIASTTNREFPQHVPTLTLMQRREVTDAGRNAPAFTRFFVNFLVIAVSLISLAMDSKFLGVVLTMNVVRIVSWDTPLAEASAAEAPPPLLAPPRPPVAPPWSCAPRQGCTALS